MRRHIFNILHDMLLILIAWLMAYWLRFNLEQIPTWAFNQAFTLVPYVLSSNLISYFIFGSYRSMWRFASLHDLLNILKTLLIGCSLLLFILYINNHLKQLPRSIIPLYIILITLLLSGSRALIRIWQDYINKNTSPIKKRVLIIGAGNAGEGLVREMLKSANCKFKPVAFIDDDPKKIGKEIHGVRVLGTCQDIHKIARKYKIDLISLAIPSASGQQIQKIMNAAKRTKIPVNTLPGIHNIVQGHVTLDLLREISIEDLLDRKPVSIDWKHVKQAIQGKIILVSGAGGSIGSEVCRQLAILSPKILIAIDHNEYNLFNLEQEFLETWPKIILKNHLIDVRDQIGINNIINIYKPQIIFHAAAYKHVPLLQDQIREAVYNNIIGTKVIAEAAVQNNVEHFVMVSTDKAVNPENIMGACKRAAEMICQALNNYNKTYNKTKFITVRFGNVLDSAGSVVPIFKKQIAKGGPITVTHPEITRYFMTIPEAAQLILQAMALGDGGEIFVLDMGAPVKIKSLAEHMIRLAGKKLGIDIEIKYTSLRPGEKLFEELFHEKESLEPTKHIKILRAQSRNVAWDDISQLLDQLNQACNLYDLSKLHAVLSILVPEMKTTQSSKVVDP